MANAQVGNSQVDDKDIGGEPPVSGSRGSYVPFKERFLAWWHGDGTGARPRDGGEGRLAISRDDWSAEHEPPWSPARIAAMEAVWGAGYLVPGGNRYSRTLLAVLSPSSKMSVLDLTAGLGGPARALAEQYNLWMDAFEPVDRLAREGQRRSLASGFGKRVPIRPIDLDTFELPQRRYDAIYSRERLFAVADKDRVLDQLVGGLKERGQLLLTDFVAPPESRSASRSIAVRQGESARLWTMRQYRRALDRRGFQFFLVQDISQEYLARIHAAWAAVPDIIHRDKLDRRQVAVIMQEGEVWLARNRALRDGKLRVMRIHAQIT